MKAFTTRISEELHEWLRTHAFENKISIAEVVRKAIEAYKNENENK